MYVCCTAGPIIVRYRGQRMVYSCKQRHSKYPDLYLYLYRYTFKICRVALGTDKMPPEI